MSNLFARDLVTELIARVGLLPKAVASVDELPKNADPGPHGFTHKVAAIWVGYSGSTYDKPEALDVPVQQRLMIFDLTISVRDLGGPTLVSELVEQVRRLVHGVRLSVGGRIQLVRDGFVSHKDGIWRHEVIVAVPMSAIPVGDDPVIPPKLKEFTLEDEDGNVLGHLEVEEQP